MLKKIVLIRHSFAENGLHGTADFDRKLTPKGERRAELQAGLLLKMKIFPDLIITSTAQRAFETTQIISAIFDAKNLIKQSPLLYNDYTTNEFFDLLSGIDNSHTTVFVVGHNPNISIMSSRLDGRKRIDFDPCTMALFEISGTWSSVEVGCGKLLNFLP